MTVSFLQMLGDGKDSPTMTVQNPAVGNRSPVLMDSVGEIRLSRAQREAAIRRALSLAVKCEATAKHARQLVAQLKELSDEQA